VIREYIVCIPKYNISPNLGFPEIEDFPYETTIWGEVFKAILYFYTLKLADEALDFPEKRGFPFHCYLLG